MKKTKTKILFYGSIFFLVSILVFPQVSLAQEEGLSRERIERINQCRQDLRNLVNQGKYPESTPEDIAVECNRRELNTLLGEIIEDPDSQQLRQEERYLREENTRIKSAQEQIAAEKATQPNAMWKCDWKSWGDCPQWILSSLGAFVQSIMSVILVLSSSIFHQAINVSINSFSYLADAKGISNSWRIIRNFANIGFIFILLYAAIGMVLQLSSVNSKKIIRSVIIIALLINFSAFFTRVLIDASNLLASQTYKSAKVENITQTILSKSAVFNSVTGIRAVANLPSGWQTLWEPFGFGILMLVTSFVLFAGAILFLIRTIRLLFLIVLSPLAYFFSILPKTQSYSSKWWEALFKDLLFAPIYIIMISIVITILGEDELNKTFQTGSLIFFIIIIIFMAMTLLVANSLGASGAGAMMKWGKKLRGGTTGFLGRHTAGRWAHRIAESKKLANFAANNPRIGGALKSIADAGAGANFGSKTSFKKDIEQRVKKAGWVKDKLGAEGQAQYIASLGEPKVDVFGLRRLPLLGADRTVQQATYEKLKVDERAKLHSTIEKELEKIKETNPDFGRLEALEREMETARSQKDTNKINSLQTQIKELRERIGETDYEQYQKLKNQKLKISFDKMRGELNPVEEGKLKDALKKAEKGKKLEKELESLIEREIPKIKEELEGLEAASKKGDKVATDRIAVLYKKLETKQNRETQLRDKIETEKKLDDLSGKVEKSDEKGGGEKSEKKGEEEKK